MTVDTLLMVLGVFVATLPFLGFPQSWDTTLFMIAGIAVVALGIVVRRRGQAAPPPPSIAETYAESAHRHEEMAQ